MKTLENRQPVSIECVDGFVLTAHVFEPRQANGKLILISTATAVRARFYFDYATFLASYGFTVTVFDWRGIGDNQPASLKGFGADMRDWGSKDLPAVIDWADKTYEMPITGIGHSFGGQAFGLAKRADRFEKLLLVASGSGYWGHWPAPGRYLFATAVGILPAITRMVGYLPGKALGIGENLPRNVALQWLRWCRSPDYLGTYDGHRAISVAVRSLGFSDDNYAPPAARRWLLNQYASAAHRFETIAPGDAGVSNIGHFGFFRKHMMEKLWMEPLQWLLADSA